MVVNVIGQILYLVLWLFLALLFVRFIVDWVQVFARSCQPHGPILLVLESVYTVTDPPIMFVRRFVPPLRLGSIALDTSFLIVIVACYLLLYIVRIALL